jgi:transcription initiation factor TFIIB
MTYISEKRSKYTPDIPESEYNCCLLPNIIQNNGYFVCANCGIVHSRIMNGKPRFAFTVDERNNRTNNERVYSPIGPRTIIKPNKDAKGNYLSPRFISKFKRLAKINQHLVNAYERNLWIASQTFYRLKSLFNIPDYVADDANKIYQIATKKKMAMGRGIEAIISASVYCALRMNNIPIFMEDLIKNTDITKKRFLSSYRMIYRLVLPELHFKLKPLNPIDYIDKLRDELHLSMKCRHVALDLIEKCEENGQLFAGRDPKGIAAAALYLSSKICDEIKTQKEICNLANITEATLRARVKEIRQKNNISY